MEKAYISCIYSEDGNLRKYKIGNMIVTWHIKVRHWKVCNLF